MGTNSCVRTPLAENDFFDSRLVDTLNRPLPTVCRAWNGARVHVGLEDHAGVL
jgi:hypothetical protein